MNRLPPFDFYAPATLSEAADILARGNARILAGGTDLVVGMKQGVQRPRGVVWLGNLSELREISIDAGGILQIGAMCTLDEIGRNELVIRNFPVIARAVRSVASPQIRNRATIGGNICLATRCLYYDQSEFWRSSLGYCLKHGNGICHAAPELRSCSAVFCSDLAPLLIGLNATVAISGSGSGRTIPLPRLYANDGASHLALQPSEMITRISVPSDRTASVTFLKLRRRDSVDYPLVNVAARLEPSGKTSVRTIRIVVGAMASAPVEFTSQIDSEEPSERNIERIAASVSAETRPLPNVDGAVSYRKRMLGVLVRRAVADLLM